MWLRSEARDDRQIGGRAASDKRNMPVADVIDRVETVDAALNYVEPGASMLRRFVATGAEVNNFGCREEQVSIRNGRPLRDRLTMDVAGFELIDHASAVKNFLDEADVAAVYPAEAVDIVKRATGASSAFVTNWNLRSTDEDEVEAFKAQGRNGRTGRMQPPGFSVHIDQYPDVAERFASALYAERAPDGPGYHRFINMSLWRTFSEPPQDQPLALCDFASLANDEGLRNALIFGDSIPDEDRMHDPIEGEDGVPAATLFKYRPTHRWYYYPNMTRDEALLFKFHDSNQSVAWRVPHSAFLDHSAVRPNPRKSIELRCTAFFEN
jgi:hypothetical protein